MSFRFSSRRICLAAAAVMLLSLLECTAQVGGKQRRWQIEFSTPKNNEGDTNLTQFTNKKDGLKQLDENFYKTPQSFMPQSSLDGVVAPPNRPQAGSVIQNKRVKELLEKKKHWIFASPEELLAGPTAEDVLKSPKYDSDGQEKKETPLFDRFYRGLAKKRSGANNMLPSKEDDLFGSPSKSKSNDEVATQDDSKLPSGLRESAEKLNKQFQPNGGDNPFLQAEAHGNLMDTFGLDMKPPTKEQVQEHKKYMDGYRSVVERSWRPPEAPTPGNPLATIADSATPAWKPTTGLPSSPSLAPSKRFGAPSDMVSPSLGPTALPDVNLQALGQTKSMAVLPKMDSPRVAPVAPTFTAPTRSFR